MEISPSVSVNDWLENAEAAGAATDQFVEESASVLASAGFWGTVAAGVWVALKFIPQLAPAYSGLANVVSTVLAPKVHQDKVRQVQQYADHYVQTVKVIEDVANQLPDSNGLKNVKGLLKKVTANDFHSAVQKITADVHPNKPEFEIIHRQPSSNSQILKAVN